MNHYSAPFEVHVHGQIVLRSDVDFAQLQEALGPLWRYTGAHSLAAAANSLYDDEPGLHFDEKNHLLQMCWTVAAHEDFRQALDDMCMNLNELSSEGSPIEITFYDAEFDEDEDGEDRESGGARDDFFLLFVGPTPAAIMAVQRDMLIQDVVQIMERHFEPGELQGVVAEIDKLFTQRFDNLVNSLELGRIAPRGNGGGRGNGRRRHLH